MVVNSYMIRVDCEDLLSKKEMLENLETNGLKIVKFALSSFGNCYFFEVIGEYLGEIKINKLDTKSCDFCWSV